MLVSTNPSSLSAQRMLFQKQQGSIHCNGAFSDRFKINKAQDDVASAIADRMTLQVCGLNMAVKNVNDAIAMLSVADSAASDITDMLQRMRELAIQAASDTNSAADRQYLQGEVDSLIQEIDRVATQTQYNGESLLDSSRTGSLQIGANANQTIGFSIASISPASLARKFADLQTSTGLTQLGNEVEKQNHSSIGQGAVDLSSDGLTMAIGSPYNNDGGQEAGLVQVYTSGKEGWLEKGTPIIGSVGSQIGRQFRLVNDGDTPVIRSSGTYFPEVSIYDWDGSNWAIRGERFTSPEYTWYQNFSISEDGSTLSLSTRVPQIIKALSRYTNGLAMTGFKRATVLSGSRRISFFLAPTQS